MKKLFLTLTLIAGLAPRPAQAMEDSIETIFLTPSPLLYLGTTIATAYASSRIATLNVFPFNRTTKKYQTNLLTAACGIGSGILVKALGYDITSSVLAGGVAFVASTYASGEYADRNLGNAIRNNNTHQITNLLSKPGPIEYAVSSYLTTALAQNIGPETIKVLIKHSKYINFTGFRGSTTLMTAIEHNYGSDILQCIIDKGAHVNTPQNNNGDTPLIQAINSAPQVDPEIFRQQLEILSNAGADPNIQNNAGQNAFDLAGNLQGEHATIFTGMIHSKDSIEKLLPFLRAFEIQKQ